MSSIEGHIAGLFIYPVKGCSGIFLRQACLTPRGLEHDRRWMIVTPTGRFLTQREVPRLANLRPDLSSADLVLRAQGETLATVPIADVGEPVEVRVWRDAVAALAPDVHADNVLSEWLGRQVRLVRFPERVVRPCDPAYAASGSHTGFADADGSVSPQSRARRRACRCGGRLRRAEARGRHQAQAGQALRPLRGHDRRPGAGSRRRPGAAGDAA
jgi:uncharacterized protein YcbX